MAQYMNNAGFMQEKRRAPYPEAGAAAMTGRLHGGSAFFLSRSV